MSVTRDVQTNAVSTLGGMMESQPSSILGIAVVPSPPDGLLIHAIEDAAEAMFGRGAVASVLVNQGTCLLIATVGGVGPARLEDVAARQALEASLTAQLGAAGWRNCGVAVEWSGGPLGVDEHLRYMLEKRSQALREAARTVASSRANGKIVASLMEGEIRTLFQPIVDARSGAMIGYEALSRGPKGHHLERPDRFLAAAADAGLHRELDMKMDSLARGRARERLPRGELLLFVNVTAARFEPYPGLVTTDWLSSDLWPRERTVLELTEHTPLSGSEELLRRLQYLRDNGERFALDDAGAGFSGLASLALLTPEFVKVDIALVRGCDRDPVKQAIISALVHYVKRANGVLVAEGVETVAERATVQDLGVDCIQGFLVGKPVEDPNGAGASERG